MWWERLRRPPVRWISLFACLMLEAVAGSSYAFSVYSNQLKANLNYSQADIEAAGSIGNIGLYLSIVAGLCFDAIGPTATGIIGAALCATGYALLWAASKGLVPTPVALVSLYCFLWSHGSAWLDTVGVSTTVKNFRANKATVLGLAKALFGLSASMLTLAYTSLFKPDVEVYLLFLAILIPVVAVPAAIATRLAQPADAAEPITRGDGFKLLGGFLIVAVLMTYLCSVSLAQANGSLPSLPVLAIMLIPMVLSQLILLLPCGDDRAKVRAKVSAIRSVLLHGDGNLESAITAVEKREAETGLLAGVAKPEAEEGEQDKGSAASSAATDSSGATFVEGALSVDFPLIMLTLFTGTGAGLVMINNLAQVTKALGASADGADVYVVILSIANCLGRLIIGAISDATARYISRPLWLAFAVASMGGSMALASVSNLNILYATVAWTGASYGMFWSIGPALISDRFGQANFAAIYSLSSVSTGIASYTLSAQMASSLYQQHAPAGSTTCTGEACFQETFIILAAMCGAGALSALILTWRLRGLYGADGSPIAYTKWRAHPNGTPSSLARLVQRKIAPLCCCRFGRGLVVTEEQWEDLKGGREYSGKSGKELEEHMRRKDWASEWK